MRYLLDTHLLLWAVVEPERLSASAIALIEDVGNDLAFSVASLWEVVIKSARGRPDFEVDAPILRAGLLDVGFNELDITGPHVLAVGELPALHRDPFDRLLVAQARTEGIILVTADRRVAAYGSAILLV